jgi:hypothetical protein
VEGSTVQTLTASKVFYFFNNNQKVKNMKKTYVIFACIIIVAVTVTVLVYASNLQTPLFQTVKLEISNVAGSSMEKSVSFDVKNVWFKKLGRFLHNLQRSN